MTVRGKQLAGLALVIACYAGIFGRAVSYAYVWDDVPEIARSALFDEPLAVALRATQSERIDPFLSHLSGIELAYDSYRPLTVASHWVEIRLWGRDPLPMHLDNLLLGAITIVLAFALARRWLGSTALALVPTALFALHPAHVESIAYISGRGDLLAGLFTLAAALLALRAGEAARNAVMYTAAACLAFALSLLSKEVCIGLPVAVAALLWTKQTLRKRWWIPAAMLGVAIGYLVVRAAVVSTTSSLAVGDTLARLPGVWLQCVRVIVFPFDLSTERPYDGAYVAVGWALVLVGVIAALIYVVRRGVPGTLPAWASGLAWFVVLVSPAALVIFSTKVVSDRYVFVPLLGLAIALTELVGWAIRRLPGLRWPLVGLSALLGLLVIVVAVRQVPVWRDDESLDRNAVEMTPDSSAAHYRLGNVMTASGRWSEALDQFQLAAALDPRNFHALDNLGVCLMRTQRFAEAEDVLVRAVAASPPAQYRTSFNLGVARLALGKHAEGCADLRRALAINPRYEVAVAELQRSCR